MLGICAPYANNEATQVACRIARWAASRCEAYTFYSSLPVVRRIGVPSDTDVQDAKLLFTDASASCSSVLWTYVPPAGYLYQALASEKKVYIYIDPRSLSPQHREVLLLASGVLAPSRQCADFLRKRWRLARVEHCPFAAGIIPQTREGLRLRSVRVALPLVGEAAGELEWASAFLVACLARNSHVWGKIIWTPSRVRPKTRRWLRSASQHFEGRLELVSAHGFFRGVQLLDVDLLFWPVLRAGTGCVPALAAATGVPTLAVTVPPMDEYVGKLAGYLVPSAYRLCDTVSRLALPDADALAVHLDTLVNDPLALRRRSRDVRAAASGGDAVFDGVLDRMIGE